MSKLLGHSDIRTTMIYAKAGVSVLRSAVERLELKNGKELVMEVKKPLELLGKNEKGGVS